MNKQERVAIVRLFVDIIRADVIVDEGELRLYSRIKDKYKITREIERLAVECSLSEAVDRLSNSDSAIRRNVLEECHKIVHIDGYCAKNEALLMIALNLCLSDDTVGRAEFFSIHNSEVSIESNQVLYVECAHNDSINAEIEQNFRQIYNEFCVAGFDFVYVPYIAKRLQQCPHNTFKEVAAFLAPHFTEKEILSLIDQLVHITTKEFCCDQLCNRLGMQALRDRGPSLLIKISDDYVNEEAYMNFLRVDLRNDVMSSVKRIIEEYLDILSADTLFIPKSRENRGKFPYRGFYKQLFDMYSLCKGKTSTLVIDPYNGELKLPEIGCEITGMRRKEKALYAMILSETAKGGVNFNPLTSVSQKKVYEEQMRNIKKTYAAWYRMFGGEKDKTPDIENPEIRNPMISVIRSSINKLSDFLKNVDDYNIRKDYFGNYTVPLDKKLLKITNYPEESNCE